MKARAVYYVRTGEREYLNQEQENQEYYRMSQILGRAVDDNTVEGILTVGVEYYHDDPYCPGHASVFEECNAT